MTNRNTPFDARFACRGDRRRALQVLASLGAVALGPMVPRPLRAAPDDQPMFMTWPSYDNPAMYPGYVEKYGEPPRFAIWGDEEEGVSKLLSGFRPDLIYPCFYKIQKWYETGLLDEIDTSRLTHWPDVLPKLVNLDGVKQDGKVVWVPVDWGQTSVIYRADLAPEYVDNETYGILWDPKYRKRVAAFDSLIDGVVIAGLMAGIPDMFDYTKDEDLEKTREKTRALADQVRFFSNDPTTLEQGIASGEIIAATVWNESFMRLKAQGLDVRYMTPKEGRLTWVCGVSIIKDSPFRDKAHEVIDSLLDPRSRVWEIENFGYGAATKTPYAQMTDDQLAAAGQARDVEATFGTALIEKPILGEERLQAMFDDVKAGL